MNRFPRAAVIAVTSRCNSKCSFCNIWQIPEPCDLPIEVIDRLPKSLRTILVTGGEPLLHERIGELMERVAKRPWRVVINTNGSCQLQERLSLKVLRKIGIRFSLDGIGSVHDLLRGMPGSYEGTLQQIENLQALGVKNIGISSVFSDKNSDQIKKVYRLTRKLKVGFTCLVAGNSALYYHKDDNVIDECDKMCVCLHELIVQEVKRCSFVSWWKAMYLAQLQQYIKGRVPYIVCSAGRRFCFVQATGRLYACNMRDLMLGDLKTQTFEELWNGSSAQSARQSAGHCTQPCWTTCNAFHVMKGNIPKYFFGLLRHLIAR